MTMIKNMMICIIYIMNIMYICGFLIQKPSIKIPNVITKCIPCNVCNERFIYGKYILGLRKTRRLLKNNTNINNIINFTNEFIANYTISNTEQPITNLSTFKNININNTEIGIKTITMSNLVLDVSNIQQIHISTKKDKLIINLDKKENNMFSVLQNINNIDSIINSILLLGKILNISP